MGILFRLLIVIVAILYRIFGSRLESLRFKERKLGDLPIRFKESKGKNSQLVEYRLSVETHVYFMLRGESWWTRLCKRIGLGIELQLGIPEFDDAFYVASDHPGFHAALREDSRLRSLLIELKKIGLGEIICTGNKELRLIRRQSLGADPFEARLEPLIQELRDHIPKTTSSARMLDPWIGSIAVFEMAVWILGAYGFGSYTHHRIDDSQVLLRPMELQAIGLSVALSIVALWLFFIGVILRRSSRIPLLIGDLFFFMTLSVLFTGFQAVADFNRIFDRSDTQVTRALVLKKYSRSSGIGKNRKISFFVELRFGKNPNNIPTHLRISSWDHFKLTERLGVDLHLRSGALGFAYIDDILPAPAPDFVSLEKPALTRAQPIGEATLNSLMSWRAPDLPPYGEGAKAWSEVKYGSGKLRQREPIVNGIREGRARYWHENGQLYTEIPWVHDQKHGCFVLKREDGTVEQILSYQEGKPHGLLSWHDAKGKIQRLALYSEGSLLEVPEAQLMSREHLRPCRSYSTE